MKTNKTSLLVILILLVPMVPFTASAVDSLSFFSADQLAGFDVSPTEVQSLSANLVAADALPELTPFSTDLVNSDLFVDGGEGVYVAVLDTGLVPEWPFFFSEANIRDDLGIGFSRELTLYDPDTGALYGGPLEQVDFVTEMASGHGTHVASSVVGFNYNNIYWINGVAPKASIIPVRVLDAWNVTGTDGNYYPFTGGFNDMIAAGIYYVADLASQLDGPVIINMSLGGGYSSFIEDAIDYAISQGVIIVASAGNNDYEGMGWPGALPQVISAAAVGWNTMLLGSWVADVPENLNENDVLGNNHQLFLAPFSSRPNKDLGQKHQDLDVAAPGMYVVGPYKPEFTNDLGYWFVSGTSMASPHVAGIAALVAQAHPDLTQSEMEFILKLAARGNPLPADGSVYAGFGGFYFTDWDGGDYGAGFLTADAALSVAATHT